MNIALMRLRPLIRELKGIRTALERIAECYEEDLSLKGVQMKPYVTSKNEPEPTLEYEEEDLTWARENIEFLKRRDKLEQEERERDQNNLDKLGTIRP